MPVRNHDRGEFGAMEVSLCCGSSPESVVVVADTCAVLFVKSCTKQSVVCAARSSECTWST